MRLGRIREASTQIRAYQVPPLCKALPAQGRAVTGYLDHHGLIGGIALIVARTSHDPALLKPSPYLTKPSAA